jgi:hypothetical protein
MVSFHLFPQLFLFVMVCLIRQGRIDIFDISSLFRGQAADEIFRVAAWTREELVVSRGAASDKLTPKN